MLVSFEMTFSFVRVSNHVFKILTYQFVFKKFRVGVCFKSFLKSFVDFHGYKFAWNVFNHA